MLAALWLFASAQDAGYTPENQPLTSKNGRSAVQKFVNTSILVILTTSIVTALVNASGAMPCLATIAGRIRGSLRTRSRSKFAPAVRYMLIFLILASWAPLVGTLIFQLKAKYNGEIWFAADAEQTGHL